MENNSYTWKYADGEETTEELTAEWVAVLEELDRTMGNSDHKETRRHLSLQAIDPMGVKLRSRTGDPEERKLRELEQQEKAAQLERLAEYRQRLPKRHQELLYALYEEGMTEEQLAKKRGVSKAAISQQKRTAIKKLNYFFGNP